jgi:nucleoid DNA-binding protein
MRKAHWLALGALVGILGLVASAQEKKPPVIVGPDQPKGPVVVGAGPAPKPSDTDPLIGRLAKASRLKEEDILNVLQALGPAIREDLIRGKTVNLQGLGVFRVVRVPEHRDLIDGKPGIVASNNTVEFLPSGEVVTAVNAENVQPAVTVPVFQYNALPGQLPSEKVGRVRTPDVRVP